MTPVMLHKSSDEMTLDSGKLLNIRPRLQLRLIQQKRRANRPVLIFCARLLVAPDQLKCSRLDCPSRRITNTASVVVLLSMPRCAISLAQPNIGKIQKSNFALKHIDHNAENPACVISVSVRVKQR